MSRFINSSGTGESSHEVAINSQFRKPKTVRNTAECLRQALPDSGAKPANHNPSRAGLMVAAEELLRRRLPVIPCNDKTPCDPNGRALLKWQSEPISAERVEKGIRGADRPAIGLILGPASGLIDIEPDSEAEEKLLDDLFGGEPIPDTPSFQSTRGKHYLFLWDERFAAIQKGIVNYRNGSADKLGIRLGSGDKAAQSIIPPSQGRKWILSFDDVVPARLPEFVIEKILKAADSKVRSPGPASPHCTGVHHKALQAMQVATKAMEDGQDGSKRLFTVACRAVEFNLSDAAAVATIRAYEADKPFPRSYSEAEVLARIRDAELEVERGSEICITNYRTVEVEAKDQSGETKTKTIIEAKSLDEIIDEVSAETNDWPRRADNVLFVHDPEHGIRFFDGRGVDGLFGWLRRNRKLDWRVGSTMVSQRQLFAEYERTATHYDAIEELPHEPPLERIYYACKENTAGGDGKHLRWLLDRFRPETTTDRDLIQAAMMTMFWGGHHGSRPTFVITADGGRGVGKTKCAEIITYLAGGTLGVDVGEDIGALKQRLLSAEGLKKRAALIDNLKSMKFSWAELESLITARTISGKRMYVGEGQRPNVLTWFVTVNGASLGKDMSQRSVIIKLAKGENNGPWYDETIRYIDLHRNEIIGDLLAALRANPSQLTSYTRWAAWEHGVLLRLPDPCGAQRLIMERQAEANCEMDEAEVVEDLFSSKLAEFGFDPLTAQVRIPVATVAEWFNLATGEHMKTTSATRRLKQMAIEGAVSRLSYDSSRSQGRNFIWTGENADVYRGRIANDLQKRINSRSGGYQ